MDFATTLGWVATGTGFTSAMTALGAASVFLIGKRMNPNYHRMALGLAAGIMIAASVWSLLIPAMESTPISVLNSGVFLHFPRLLK